MAIASRSVRSPGVSFRGIFFTGLALILVVGLFFIPEIIQFQRKLTGSTQKGSGKGEMKTLQTATSSKPVQKESQLSKIASLIESGYLERLGKGEVSKQEVSATTDAKGKPAKDAKSVGPATDSGLSWKSIKGRNSRQALKKSRDETLEILKTVPSDRVGTRFTLLNFANGIDQVLDGNAEKTLGPSEAVRFLEGLQTAASREMLREGIDRVAYKRFMSLNFGPAISASSLRLSGQLVAFNPQMTLTKVNLSARQASANRSGTIQVGFDGYVVGEDVESIEIVSAGIKIEDIKPKKSDSSGVRNFKVKSFELRGNVSMRVRDNKGRVYQKLYSFYPRSKIFEYRNGRFMIPKVVSKFDNRLDRFFTLKQPRLDTVSEAYLESQGFERF